MAWTDIYTSRDSLNAYSAIGYLKTRAAILVNGGNSKGGPRFLKGGLVPSRQARYASWMTRPRQETPPPEEPNGMRLSVTSYVILGMVAIRGPSTTYEIQRALNRTLGWFWAFTQSSLYSESRRLAAMGLLTREVEGYGRRRTLYTITPQALKLVRDWLESRWSAPMEIRDLAQAKLFFSELTTPEHVIALAKAEIELYTERIQRLRHLEARFRGRSELASRLAPIPHGIGIYEAAIKFWRDIAANPPRPGDRPLAWDLEGTKGSRPAG